MTVIVYDGETLATDSGTFSDGMLVGNMNKIHIIKQSNSVFAAAGSVSDVQQVVNWLNGTAEKPSIGEDLIGIQVFADGACVEWDNKLTPYECLVPFVSGAAQEMAMGALKAGASAVQAVEICCANHIYCNQPVNFEIVNILENDETHYTDINGKTIDAATVSVSSRSMYPPIGFFDFAEKPTAGPSGSLADALSFDFAEKPTAMPFGYEAEGLGAVKPRSRWKDGKASKLEEMEKARERPPF